MHIVLDLVAVYVVKQNGLFSMATGLPMCLEPMCIAVTTRVKVQILYNCLLSLLQSLNWNKREPNSKLCPGTFTHPSRISRKPTGTAGQHFVYREVTILRRIRVTTALPADQPFPDYHTYNWPAGIAFLGFE
jgi:hypothetical protein